MIFEMHHSSLEQLPLAEVAAYMAKQFITCS